MHTLIREENLVKRIFSSISVAKIVAQQIGLDATSICAALLHDVVEDTKFSLKDIETFIG